MTKQQEQRLKDALSSLISSPMMHEYNDVDNELFDWIKKNAKDFLGSGGKPEGYLLHGRVLSHEDIIGKTFSEGNAPTPYWISPFQNEWIDVKDRLPENVEDVLVATDDGILAEIYCYIDSSKEWYPCSSKNSTMLEITHWMPLPESPKA